MESIQDVLATAGTIPSAKFGSSTDSFEIETDGSTMRNGDATMWDDVTGSLVARRLESTVGRLNYNYTENSITMQDDGNPDSTADNLIFNFQKPHGAKVASTFNLHIHWEQVEDGAVEFTLQYRIQSSGGAKTTAWTTVVVDTSVNNVFAYTSGTLNQITQLADIDWSTSGISATCQFKLSRTDDIGLDDIEATFIDGHVEFDNIGSRQEYIK